MTTKDLAVQLAGSLHKPDQQTAVMPWSALRLVGSLDSARRLPGVGSATAKKLETIGVRTVADLQRADPNGAMARLLGAKLAHQVPEGIHRLLVRLVRWLALVCLFVSLFVCCLLKAAPSLFCRRFVSSHERKTNCCGLIGVREMASPAKRSEST